MKDGAPDGTAPLTKSGIAMRRFQDKFEQMAWGRFHWVFCMTMWLVALSDGMFFEMHPFLFTTFERELDMDELKCGLLISSMSLGVALAAICSGFISDRIGRLPLLYGGFATSVLFGGLTAVAPTWRWLVALRFLTGIGMGLQRPVRLSITAEFLPMAYRGTAMVAIRSGWPASRGVGARAERARRGGRGTAARHQMRAATRGHS